MNWTKQKFIFYFAAIMAMLLIAGCGDDAGRTAVSKDNKSGIGAKATGMLGAYPAANLVCEVRIYQGSCAAVGVAERTIAMVKTDAGCTSGCSYIPAESEIVIDEGDYAAVVVFWITQQAPRLPIAAQCENFTVVADKNTPLSFDTYTTDGQPEYIRSIAESLNWFNYDGDALININDPDPWHSSRFKMAQPAFPNTGEAGPVNSAGGNFKIKSVTVGQNLQGDGSSAGFKMKIGQAYQAR